MHRKTLPLIWLATIIVVALITLGATTHQSDFYVHRYSLGDESSPEIRWMGSRVLVDLSGDFGLGSCSVEFSPDKGTTWKNVTDTDLVAANGDVTALIYAAIARFRLTCSGGVVDVDFFWSYAGGSGHAPGLAF